MLYEVQNLAVMTYNNYYKKQPNNEACCAREDISAIPEDQARRRNPSGKPTNEGRARTAGLFQSR